MSSLPKEMPALQACWKPRLMICVSKHDRVLLAAATIDFSIISEMFFLGQALVDDVEATPGCVAGQLTQQHAARGGLVDLRIPDCLLRRSLATACDLRVQRHQRPARAGLPHVGETSCPRRLRFSFDRQVIQTQNDILRRHDDRLPLAGDRMLLVDIISTRASSCASSDSGT